MDCDGRQSVLMRFLQHFHSALIQTFPNRRIKLLKIHKIDNKKIHMTDCDHFQREMRRIHFSWFRSRVKN
jgi:hypothetical protein